MLRSITDLRDARIMVNKMDELPEKVVRFDAVQIAYDKAKNCQCENPHYEVDYQNRMVQCLDCGAIVEPLEALMRIAKDQERWDNYTERMLEQRRQIQNYRPQLLVMQALEKQYISAEKNGLQPRCPHCACTFPLSDLLNTWWSKPMFNRKKERNKP